MGKLVEDRDDAALLDGIRHLAAEDVHLGEGDCSRILHGSGVELRDEQLVILRERVRVVELVLVVGEALAGLLEDVVGVEVLPQALAREDAKRDDATRGAGQLGERRLIGAGDQCRDVGRDPRRRLELPRCDALAAGYGLGGRGVGDHLPRRGSGHGELERRLQVGLLEHGEDATRVGHLELGVEVDLAVDGVDEPVQAFAGVRVFAVGDDDEFVLEREFVERNPGVGERRGRDAASVERDGVDASGDQVDEGRRALGGGEAHGGGRPEHLRAGGQIQLDLIRLRVEDAATLLRFDAGEVFSRHFRMLPSV